MLLEARELTVGRDGVVVRSGIDAAARASQLLAVTGGNGSGKTTLALTMAGLLPPLGGRLAASEELAAGAGTRPHRWRSRELLTRIGTVFQDPEHQFLARTVREELEIGPHALGQPRPALVDELLERLRLTRLAGANPFTLSGGEQRRLSVATALATRPRVLVLDEPTFGQDAVTWSELVALIAELLDEGTAVIAATHDAEFADAIAVERLALS